MSRNLKRQPVYDAPSEARAETVAPFVARDDEVIDAVASPALALREQLRVALEDPARAPFSAGAVRNDDWSPRMKLTFVMAASSALWLLIITAGYAVFHSRLFG